MAEVKGKCCGQHRFSNFTRTQTTGINENEARDPGVCGCFSTVREPVFTHTNSSQSHAPNTFSAIWTGNISLVSCTAATMQVTSTFLLLKQSKLDDFALYRTMVATCNPTPMQHLSMTTCRPTRH
mgnify:CR=1 FL=1